MGDLPYLKSTTRLGGKGTDTRTPIFDVHFWPYHGADDDPVFAVTGEHNTIICRPPVDDGEGGPEILQWFHDKDALTNDEEGNPLENLNSVVWTYDEETLNPLLCVAGRKATIKILDVESGELVRELSGHGGSINDICVHPCSPHILATGSEDFTVRLWDIRPRFKKQPCALICAGEGHRAGILTTAFHRSGRWLLSGGFDTKINLWAVPSSLDEHAGTDHPLVVHYPHFSSTEIHASHVDSILFHADLVLSKSATENKILVWKITNFPPSLDAAVPAAPATSYGKETRSAFVPSPIADGSRADDSHFRDRVPPFQILLTLDVPSTGLIYMRFGLFSNFAAARRPMLAIGNAKSRVLFWDLQAIEDGVFGDAAATGKSASGSAAGSVAAGRRSASASASVAGRKPLLGGAGSGWQREASVATTATSGGGGGGGAAGVDGEARESSLAASATTPAAAVGARTAGTAAAGAGPGASAAYEHSKHRHPQQQLGNPFAKLKAHKTVMVPSVDFASRAVAWSAGGEWCVVVGDHGMVCVFKRGD